MMYGEAQILRNDYIRTKPRHWARETACARLSTASFMKMFLMCDFTVSGAIPSSRAISLFDRPWPIRSRILRSRGLSELHNVRRRFRGKVRLVEFTPTGNQVTNIRQEFAGNSGALRIVLEA